MKMNPTARVWDYFLEIMSHFVKVQARTGDLWKYFFSKLQWMNAEVYFKDTKALAESKPADVRLYFHLIYSLILNAQRQCVIPL